VLKRIVASIVGLSVLLALYMVYVRVFGHFSNLEPIDPELLRAGPINDSAFSGNAATIHRTKQIARDVFGPDSWQANADIALNWERSGVIIYILDYEPVDQKTLRLVPFSLVHIEATKKGNTRPQIVTLEGKEALLEFDRPVDPIRMTTAKPLGVKITGNVQVQADRGTPDPLDDLVVYTDNLEFNDAEKRIWTAAPVRIVSADTVMTGTGGEVHLNLDDSKKSRDLPMFQGARDFILARDVQINMLAGAGSTLMPGASPAREEPKGNADKPRLPVTISCLGPFVYEFELAQGRFSDTVMMIRQTAEAQFDRLLCDQLTIDFSKSDAENDQVSESKVDDGQLQFRRAHATGRAVRVLSDVQAVEAIGNEMEHDATTGLTILRGDPEVVATQASNVLHGRELRFTPASQGDRSAEAVGPGSIESRDPTGDIRLVAHWTDGARIEPHANRQQLLTLVGAAEVDQPGRGTLAADRVKVWLSRGTDDAQANDRDAADGSSKWTPSRLEGIGNVVAKSDQFVLEASQRLEMTIDDAPSPTIPQATRATAGLNKSQAGAKPGAQTRPGKQSSQSPANRNQPAADPPESNSDKPPAHLISDRIRIRALRDGDRTEVSEVWTEGNVNLDQPPDDGGANAAVVRGDNLYLKRIDQKNHLEVTGRPAHVEMNELKVDGAHVCVDQPTGVAWVEGKGMMVMQSETSFDGKKLDSPGELTIAWGSNMVFTGESAEFGGGVEALQGASRLRCQRLEAFLTDRIDISAPRKKGDAAAKIEKFICTGAVTLDNMEFRGDRLEKYDHLESRHLEFVTATGAMTAQGPGIARSYSRGSANIMAPQPGVMAVKSVAAQKPPKANDDQLLMTEVHFTDRMEADRTNQIAKFFGHIEVIRAPVVNENEAIDPDKLPPNSMRLSCESLEMATKRGSGDKPYNVMLGEGNVDIEANNVFSGRGDRISYNQLHERIIFESRPGSFATLFRQTRRGQRPDVTRAFKIYYELRTGNVRVEGGIEVDLQEREADRKNMAKPPGKKL
jgi:hypothetical protein